VILFTGKFLQELGSTSARSLSHTTLLTSHANPVSALYFCEVLPRRYSDRRIRLFAVMDTPEALPPAPATGGTGAGAGAEDSAPPARMPEPVFNPDDPKFAGVLVFDTSVVLAAGSQPGVSVSAANSGAGGGEYVAGPRHAVRALDEKGVAANCSTFVRGVGELVVARSEAVYNYSIEDKGGALAISGDKLCICSGKPFILFNLLVHYLFVNFSFVSCFSVLLTNYSIALCCVVRGPELCFALSVGRYTLVVSVEERTATLPTAGATLATGNLEELPQYLKPKRPVVNIYDLKNKIICGTAKKYNLALNEKVLFVLSDNGVVYLITSSGSMIRFREKDTHRKLDVLIHQTSPPLYSLAIMLAAEEQMEPSEIMKLYKVLLLCCILCCFNHVYLCCEFIY
jgi:hypothetical protein